MISPLSKFGFVHLLLIACVVVFLVACTAPASTGLAVLPTGTASLTAPTVEPIFTQTTTRIPPFTETPTPQHPILTPTTNLNPLPPSLLSLQIVYNDDGKIKLWQSGRITNLVEYSGDPQYMDYETYGNTMPIMFSDDGNYIAFLQYDGGVWTVQPDGTGLKLIYNETEIDPTYERPYLIGWLPDTHTLLFSKIYWFATSLYSRIGTFYAADIDTGEVTRQEIFPNRGAGFFPSPDGAYVAAVSGGELNIVDANGGNLRQLSSFPWISTVVWSQASDYLFVVASPNELSESPDDLIEIWQVFLTDQPAIRLSNVPAAVIADIVSVDVKVWIAPDLTHLAYYKRVNEQENLYELHVASVDLSSDQTLFQGDIEPVVWSPDSRQFIVWRSPENPAFVFADLDGNIREVTTMAATDIDWIDAENLLLFSGAEFWWTDSNHEQVLVTKSEGIVRQILYFRQFDFRQAEISLW